MTYTEARDGISNLGNTAIVEDFGEGRRGYATGPERALLSALLFDGVQQYIGYVTATSAAVRRRFHEAYHWVHQHDSEYVFAFHSCCEALGIDPGSLRLGLINACQGRQERLKKSRRKI